MINEAHRVSVYKNLKSYVLVSFLLTIHINMWHLNYKINDLLLLQHTEYVIIIQLSLTDSSSVQLEDGRLILKNFSMLYYSYSCISIDRTRTC
jgi:hypothetical protein